MEVIKKFDADREEFQKKMGKDDEVNKLSSAWINSVAKHKYVYNFNWLGRPIIQLPTDMIAIQEIIWNIKPDLIIETGIAHGGSIIFSASMLELLGGDGQVLGIDIDIRKHNRKEIESHPMFKRITMIEGSSIDQKTINQVEEIAANKKCILVLLDSCHTHDHVLKELEAYSRLVSVDSYIVVLDTIVEFATEEDFSDRPWSIGNNPWTAVQEFLKNNENFIIDEAIPGKLLLTSAIDGYLKRVK